MSSRLRKSIHRHQRRHSLKSAAALTNPPPLPASLIITATALLHAHHEALVSTATTIFRTLRHHQRWARRHLQLCTVTRDREPAVREELERFEREVTRFLVVDGEGWCWWDKSTGRMVVVRVKELEEMARGFEDWAGELRGVMGEWW